MDEEAEAIRMQRQQAEDMSDDDFGLGASLASRLKPKSAQKSTKKVKPQSTTESVERVAKDLSKLSKEEKLQIVLSDAPELLGLLQEMKTKIDELRMQLQPTIEKVREAELPTTSGVRYLEVKMHLLLSYVIHVVMYLLLKAEGKAVKDHPVIQQLVHIRTVIERTRPVDARLKHQIDRIIKAADAEELLSTAAAAQSGDLRPNPSALVGDYDMEDEDDRMAKGGGIYKPLKRTAVMYEEEERAAAKEAKAEEKRRKRLQQSRAFQELRDEFSSRPDEVAEDKTAEDRALQAMHDMREQYEEDNMTRLTVPREERKRRKAREKQKAQWHGLDDLQDFGDLHELEEAQGMAASASKSAAGKGGLGTDTARERRTRQLESYVQQMEQQARATAAKMDQHGEADLPIVDSRRIKAASKKRMRELEAAEDAALAAQQASRNLSRSMATVAGEEAFSSDDDMYKQAIKSSVQRQRSKKQKQDADAEEMRMQMLTAENPDGHVEGKRRASKAIVKNRGLVPHRRKDLKNPRVHGRKKYEKALKRRKGQVQTLRTGEAGQYGGEATGIRSDITRSRKIVG